MSVASKVQLLANTHYKYRCGTYGQHCFQSFYVELCEKTFYAWQAIIFDVSTDEQCYQTRIDKALKDFTCSKNCNEKHSNVPAET